MISSSPHMPPSRSTTSKRTIRPTLWLLVSIFATLCAFLLLITFMAMRREWLWNPSGHALYASNRPGVHLSVGSNEYLRMPTPSTTGRFESTPRDPRNWNIIVSNDGWMALHISILITSLLLALIGFLAFRLHRSAMFLRYIDPAATTDPRLSRCPRCRYDRTGLTPETPCPECGHTLPLISASTT